MNSSASNPNDRSRSRRQHAAKQGTQGTKESNPYLASMQSTATKRFKRYSQESDEESDIIDIDMGNRDLPRTSRTLSDQDSTVSGFTSVADSPNVFRQFSKLDKHSSNLSEISSFSYSNFQPQMQKETIKADRGSSWLCGDRNWPFYRRRYCGNKIGFFCMVVLVSIVVHTCWITPLIYSVIVPNMVQKTFEDGVKTLVITDPVPGAQNSNMRMYMALPALTFIPGQAQLIPPTKIYASSSNNPGSVFAEITLPQVTFDLNKSANISIDANFEITNVLAMTMLVDTKRGGLSSVALSTGWAIKVYGIQFYKSLQFWEF